MNTNKNDKDSCTTSSSSVEGIITQKLMIPKNTLEADKLTETTSFLPSDGASCSESLCGCGYTWVGKDGETRVVGEILTLTKEMAYADLVIDGVPFKDSDSSLRAYLEKSW